MEQNGVPGISGWHAPPAFDKGEGTRSWLGKDVARLQGDPVEPAVTSGGSVDRVTHFPGGWGQRPPLLPGELPGRPAPTGEVRSQIHRSEGPLHKALSEPAQGWEWGLGIWGPWGLGGEVVVGDSERFSSSFCLQGVGYTRGGGVGRPRSQGEWEATAAVSWRGKGAGAAPGAQGLGPLRKLEPGQACPWDLEP